MDHKKPNRIHGRGAQSRPANPYLAVRIEPDFEHLESLGPDGADEMQRLRGHMPTEYFEDTSQSIISENHSPDIPFRYSLNPYRGCSHGCSYCYARPTHEYLGLSAGLDFETKIFVKRDAARLFRQWLARPNYAPETVMLSGVTDCYQPAERRFGVTRECLKVAADCGQPISVVTKNALVTRDLDLLSQLASVGAASVAVSLTTLDDELAREMEPQASSSKARLRAIEQLSSAGVPVHAMVAPVIPGLNDSEVPEILKAARLAGATTASHILLRLPATVQAVFIEWLESWRPDRCGRVATLLKGARSGKWNDARFGSRMRGEGAYADAIAKSFEVVKRRLGYRDAPLPLRTDRFEPPHASGRQRRLF